jgi:hypothetical protein
MSLRMISEPSSGTITRPLYSIDDRFRFKLDEGFYKGFVGRNPAWNMLGYVTYLRTYSRALYDAKGEFIRSEEFCDTLKRVTEGTFTILRMQVAKSGQNWDEVEGQEKAQDFFRRMWDFKWLPPGRGLWMMGTACIEERGGAALNNCGFVSTEFIDKELSEPFVTLMDYSMLGVGMGFDVRGAQKFVVGNAKLGTDTHVVTDDREGWIALVKRALDAYAGKATIPRDVDYSKVRPEGVPIKTFGGTASGPAPLEELYHYILDTLAARVGSTLDSVDITDLMNCIGRCVVAGNVRRSSEIALGYSWDKPFLSMKDSKESRKIWEEMSALARRIPEWRTLEAQRLDLVIDQKGLSVLDEKCIAIQRSIDMLESEQKRVLNTNLDWRRLSKQWNDLPLNHHRWASNNTVFCEEDTNLTDLGKQTATNGEPGYAWLNLIQAYGRLSDPPNYKDSKALGFNPCGEQTLWNNELCCLVEDFPTRHTSLSDFKETLKMAYLYAKVVTCVPTHNVKTNAVMSRNRRIGTSMAGVSKMYMDLGLSECVRWWREGYQHIRDLDEDYSGWMGVPASIKVTSIKPGGTVPLLVGEEGGMKFPISPFYFRTIRIDRMSPLIKRLEDAGYRVETDRYTPRSMVVYFPCKAESKRYAKDISIWEQMALYVALQEHWSDNQVSATISFQPHEADDISRVLDVYKGKVKAISFLPLNDHAYVQAPYIPCTEAEYDTAMSKLDDKAAWYTMKSATAEEIHEIAAEEKFCSGDLCVVKGL